MPERYKRCSARQTRLCTVACSSLSLPQVLSGARRRVCCDGSAKPVGLDAVDANVLHVLYKNPYSVEVVPPRRRRREERRRVRLGVRFITMEHGAQLRILSVVGLRLFSSLPRDVRGRAY